MENERMFKVFEKNINAFTEEINLIKNTEYKRMAVDAISLLPDYFYTVAASASGKYHPLQDLGDGGTVRHTKTAVKIGLDLLTSEQLATTDIYPNAGDIIIVALLMHDGFKNGLEDSGKMEYAHPILAAIAVAKLCGISKDELIDNNIYEYMDKYYNLDFFNSIKPVLYNIDKSELMELVTCILTHTGKWNCNREGEVIMPTPLSNLGKIVHFGDYISSRKYIDNGFSIN